MKTAFEYFQVFAANILLRFTVLFTKGAHGAHIIYLSVLGFESIPVLITSCLTICFLGLSIYDKILTILKLRKERAAAARSERSTSTK